MAKDRYEIDFSSDPTFNSVIGLTNITFDINNVRSGFMATEDQIAQLYRDIVRNEKRRDECCRDIIIWEARVQVVRMNTFRLNGTYGYLEGGGTVTSPFDNNVNVGVGIRGLPYTVTFPLTWDDGTYVKRNAASSGNAGCGHATGDGTHNWVNVFYRYMEDHEIVPCDAISTSTNYSNFWIGKGTDGNRTGWTINVNGNEWGSFVYNNTGGTITITDNRLNTNFNIIRYYTQWVLRKAADGTTITDP